MKRTLDTIMQELDDARADFNLHVAVGLPHRHEYYALLRLEKEYSEFVEGL